MLEFNMSKGVSDKVTFKPYDVGQGELIPPTAAELRYEYNKTKTRYSGRKEHLLVYSCSECGDCPAHEKCTRAENKKLEFNPKRYDLQQKARERLKTEEGWQFYRKRGAEVETVFGQVKGNWRFRRFNGWGKDGASCEWGILMMAYNLKNITIAPRR